jgi:DNA-binding transcriptional LysR family regulator
MQPMRYDLTSLRLFAAVAECGNLTRAAEREHLAVSAVSKRISELEELVRTPLLQRYPRGVALTPAGQSLLHYARQMMQLVRCMDAELGEYAGGTKGHVRLHAVASALTQNLPHDLEAFLNRYPEVKLSLEERTGKAIVLAIADGTAEVGIVAAPTALPGLDALTYRRDRLMLAVPLQHELAHRESVHFSEALGHDFVGPHADSSLHGLMVEAARQLGRPLRLRMQVSSFDAMCRLVETRLGITVLPSGVLARPVAEGRLCAITLEDAWAQRQLFVIARDLHQLSPLARTLVDHLHRVAAEA